MTEVRDVLLKVKRLVSRPDNDFSWSSWQDKEHALDEIDGLLGSLESGRSPMDKIALLLAPTGPVQELSESSGWGRQFLTLADRCDRALEQMATAIEATFRCAVCGEPAGSIQLRGTATRAELRRESFTGSLSQPLTSTGFERLRAGVVARNARAVYALDPEFAPFYCPTCEVSYCGEHWRRWDVFDEDMPAWRDSIRGCCPRGHERMLED